MKYRRDTFLGMDEAIKSLVKGHLEKGMSLDEVREATKGALGWSEWPTTFLYWERRDIAGVQDYAMTEKEWLDNKNEVVILYKSCESPAGGRTYMLQNSFRAKKKSLVRALGSFYGCVTLGDNTIHCDDLYSEYYYSPGGSRAVEFNRILFGFLVVDSDTFPRILTSLGPAGTAGNFSIHMYVWNQEYDLWEGTFLWHSDGIIDFKFDGETTELTICKCYESHPDRPDTPACPQIVNLRQHYLENREEIEQALHPVVYDTGRRAPSFYRPPQEIYEEHTRRKAMPHRVTDQE